MKINKFKNQSGQAVLIILLGMIVSLTVVLSIVASSTSDIKVSSNEAASQRAFSAAESGVEKALLGAAGGGSVSSGATYNTTITPLSSTSKQFSYPSSLSSGDSGIFWLVSHTDDGVSLTCSGKPCFTGQNLKFCWGKTSTINENTPALEVSLYYLTTPGDFSTAKVMKAIYDPAAGAGIRTNNYESALVSSCSIAGKTYAFSKSIDIATKSVPAGSYNNPFGLLFATTRFLYNTTTTEPVGIDVTGSAGSLPSQGYVIESTGTLNDVNRKIQVSRAYSGIPPVFDAAIFSPGGLTK